MFSLIDRALGNDAWMDKYSEMEVEYLNPGISDHTPLMITCTSNKAPGGRPFRFFNYMANHSKFQAIVADQWATIVQGTAMFSVWQKLKGIKAKNFQEC